MYSISDLYLKRLCSGDGLDFMCYLLSIRKRTSTVLEKRKNDWRIDMELTINDLSKEYGRKKAVNHFSAKLTMVFMVYSGQMVRARQL